MTLYCTKSTEKHVVQGLKPVGLQKNIYGIKWFQIQ